MFRTYWLYQLRPGGGAGGAGEEWGESGTERSEVTHRTVVGRLSLVLVLKPGKDSR